LYSLLYQDQNSVRPILRSFTPIDATMTVSPMADWLLLRLPRAAGELASWLVADARGAPAGPAQSGPLTLAAAGPRDDAYVYWCPARMCCWPSRRLPVKAGAKLQQLLPYALEEQLADDIDDLHFAVGKRAGDSSRAPVAVVARALLDEWLATLRASGIEPEAIYADSELLPRNPGQASCSWKRTGYSYARQARAP